VYREVPTLARAVHVTQTVLSPDALTYGEIPSLDPGSEWPSLLVAAAVTLCFTREERHKG
jgi:hypothetical protein